MSRRATAKVRLKKERVLRSIHSERVYLERTKRMKLSETSMAQRLLFMRYDKAAKKINGWGKST